MIFSSIVTYLSIELHIGCVLASDENSGVSRTALPCHIKKWCKLYSSSRSIYLRISVTSDPMLLSISCWLLGISVVFEARASSNGKSSLFSASIALHACFHDKNVDPTYQETLASEVHEIVPRYPMIGRKQHYISFYSQKYIGWRLIHANALRVKMSLASYTRLSYP